MHEPILTRGEIKVIDFQGRDKPGGRERDGEKVMRLSCRNNFSLFFG